MLCEPGFFSDSCYYYLDGYGFPFIISILFRLFGLGPDLPITLNIFLGSFTVLLLGFLSLKLFDRYNSVGSLVFLTLWVFHVFWSNTGDKTVSALFFVLLSVTGGVMFLKEGDLRMAIFSTTSYIFAGSIRPELYIVLLPFWSIIIFRLFGRVSSSFGKKVLGGFSVSVFLIGFANVIVKLFILGTMGSKNISLMRFSNVFSNLFTSYGILTWLIVSTSALYLVRCLASKDLDYRTILLLSAFVYFFIMTSHSSTHYSKILIPVSLMFPFSFEMISGLMSKVPVKTVVSVISVIFVLFFVFNVSSGIEDYSRIKEDVERFDECMVYTPFTPLFSLSEGVRTVHTRFIFDDVEEFYRALKFSECSILLAREDQKLPDMAVRQDIKKYPERDVVLSRLRLERR